MINGLFMSMFSLQFFSDFAEALLYIMVCSHCSLVGVKDVKSLAGKCYLLIKIKKHENMICIIFPVPQMQWNTDSKTKGILFPSCF